MFVLGEQDVLVGLSQGLVGPVQTAEDFLRREAGELGRRRDAEVRWRPRQSETTACSSPRVPKPCALSVIPSFSERARGMIPP